MIKGYHYPKIDLLIFMDSHFSKFNSNENKLLNLIQFAGRKKIKEIFLNTYDKNQN